MVPRSRKWLTPELSTHDAHCRSCCCTAMANVLYWQSNGLPGINDTYNYVSSHPKTCSSVTKLQRSWLTNIVKSQSLFATFVEQRTYDGPMGSTLLEPQSRFGDKPLKFQAVFPQNRTAVLKGSSLLEPQPCFGDKILYFQVFSPQDETTAH